LGRKKNRAARSCEIWAAADFDRQLRPARRYRLRLYVAGTNQNSFVAIQSLRQLCDEVLPGRVELEVIDLYQQPELATRDHIIAAPALIKVSPLPRRMFIGDMSDRRRLLLGLGIQASPHAEGNARNS
jgi:circadian clock protein KaiB